MALYVSVIIPECTGLSGLDDLKNRMAAFESGSGKVGEHSVAGLRDSVGHWVSFDGPIELVDQSGTLEERVGFCCSEGFVISMGDQLVLVIFFVKWTRFVRLADVRSEVIEVTKRVLNVLDCGVGYLTHDQSKVVTQVLDGTRGSDVTAFLDANKLLANNWHELGLSDEKSPSVDDKVLAIRI